MSAESFSKEQVLDLQKKVSQLLESQEFALFFPNGDDGGMHSLLCSENPIGAARAVRKFLDKYFPEPKE